MTARIPVKARRLAAPLVGVIASAANFHRASKLRRPPEMFELRLDALIASREEAKRQMTELRSPLIITARHPAEGGRNNLSPACRRELLLEFLPWAAYVDVELRSVRPLHRVLEEATKIGVRRILSVHELDRPLTPKQLEKSLTAVEKYSADIFKIVACTNTPNDLETLTQFFHQHRQHFAVSAMGTGRLGRKSRLQLARAGSVLNYVHLGTAQLPGQFSLAELRRALAR